MAFEDHPDHQQVHSSSSSSTCGGLVHGTTTFLSLASCRPATLHLLSTNQRQSHIELEEPSPLPLVSQRFLDLKTVEIYHRKSKRQEIDFIPDSKMSTGRSGSRVKLDLKLNLSPPRVNVNNPQLESPSRSATVSPTSPPSSCLSSELNQEDYNNNSLRYSSSPETTSMMLVGCPRCLMYVMLSEEDPRCPKCKSTVLLDVVHENNKRTTKKSRN